MQSQREIFWSKSEKKCETNKLELIGAVGGLLPPLQLRISPSFKKLQQRVP